MNTKRSKQLLLSIGAVLVLAALLLLGYFWIYQTPFRGANYAIAKALSLPIGKVGNSFVTAKAVELQEEPGSLSQKFTAYANIKRLYVLAESYGIQNIQDPHNTLAVWWTGNEKLNPRYSTIKGFEQQVAQGVSLSELASKYSEDEITKQLEGDAGFIDLSQSLPEFRRAVEPLGKSDFVTVAMPYGLELVQVEDVLTTDEGSTLYRIRHLTLKNTSAFETWLEQELSRIPAKLYVRVN